MKQRKNLECFACGSYNAYVESDSRYRGYRGHCINCGGNWPES